MAKTPERVVRATTKYTRTHTKTYNIRCNKEYDADIIAFLAEQPNVAGYIKAMLHRLAAEAGYGHLRVANTKPPINPKAGKTLYCLDRDTWEDEERGPRPKAS